MRCRALAADLAHPHSALASVSDGHTRTDASILYARSPTHGNCGTDLICIRCVHELLGEECSGHYKNFLQNVCKSVAQVSAENFSKAMDGWGTDEDLLIELTLTRTNQDINHTKEVRLLTSHE